MADPIEVGPKKPWQSKTLWMNLIGAIAALFIPSVADFIASNPEVVALIWSGINFVLRLVTKDQIQIKA